MAYATVPQADGLQRAVHSPTATPSPSPPSQPAPAHSSLSAAFEDLAATLFVDQPTQDARSKVADVLKSLTSSTRSRQSYELVEEEDHEHPLPTPKMPRDMSAMMDQGVQQSPDQAIPARTASISRHLPLNHPAPDLQSLQGAYLKNVERLEDSAARLSMGSSLEEELHKMKQEIRRTESRRRTSNASGTQSRQYSATSISNSIIAVNATARSGGYSPAAFVTSPVGSVKSQHRRPSQRESRISKTSHPSHLITSLPEPELEGRPLDSEMVRSPPSHAAPFTASPSDIRPTSSSQDEPERPSTAASGDTYRQAQHLFTDFDGTHFSPDEGFMSRRISLVQPPLARDSKAYKEPQPGEKMIYYPAPVPVMLNLPKRLSQMNFGERDKRRLKALSGIPDEMRKSAAFLPGEEVEPASPERTRRASRPMSNIPPQLRASAFFDHMPSISPEVKLKHGSAVATLDDILDAAAHAPVSAFTDHPIVGHLGSEVYGQESRKSKLISSEDSKRRRQSSVTNLLNKRKSNNVLSRRMSQPLDEEVPTADDDPEHLAERSIAPDADELTDGMHEEEDENEQASGDDVDEHQRSDDEESHQLGFLGAPTTLLAELQMRKAQQKSRNRTAANAFPNGMHSTLLELDAVAQLQQKSRKTKHVALAWEDQEAVSRENHDDDDVPLGLLFPEKEQQNQVNHNRPLGLMEKREFEENEPLSSRRARLRGESYQPPVPPNQESSPGPQEPTPAIHLSGVDNDEGDDEEEEGESLAQRARRMKEKKENRASLANDIASELGLQPEDLGGSKPAPAPVEETLGQRRKRLQQEALKTGIKPRTSMADLLQANPVGHRNPDRVGSNESRPPPHANVQAQQPYQASSFAQQQPMVAPPPYYPQQPLLGHNFQANGMPTMSQVYGAAPNPYAGYAMPQMQMPGMHGVQGTNFGFGYGMNTNQGGTQLPFPMGQPTGFDAIGMGPPLNPQQRANIDRWRQGIA